MDSGGVVDGGSPRRGSLTSLHRQSSGSFSHGSRLAATTTHASSNNNTNTLNNLYKDLDKFTRYFIVKSVQVIVQSRINGSKKLKTECKPSGNDWFNINIADIAEVSDQTKAVLDCDRLSVRSDWRVCCEISLRTSDGSRLVLEHWIISNKSNLSSAAKRGNMGQQILPGRNQLPSNRSPPIHLTTSNNTGIGSSSATNSSVGRVRTATFSNTMRTRLNSIDDCSGDTNKLLINTVNENFDMKPSTSCFSLSTTSANPTTDHNITTTTIAASPSISSLNNINNTASSQQQHHHHQGSKTSAMSSIYTIYNRMSLLLKTLMTTTHIVPAHRLASSTSPTDPCVICYRIYSAPFNYSNTKTSPGGVVVARGSIEDLSHNADSPNRRSLSSNSSFGSVNIREFVSPDELDHFCPIIKLGSIKSEVSELDISLCYRTDDKQSNHMMRSPRAADIYSKILEEDCITAAKQLLAGNGYENNNNNFVNATRNDIDYTTNGQGYNIIDHPLRPAFASKEPKFDNKGDQDPNLSLIESAFEGLLKIHDHGSTNGSNKPAANEFSTTGITTKTNSHSKNAHSEPIQVPNGSLQSKHMELCQNASAGSTPKSLTDSFVFVDLNPPFASEEQNDLNSFFHGPSPTFNNNGSDNFKDVDELTNQLAVIEASASQVDEFVDNICVSEDDEEEE